MFRSFALITSTALLFAAVLLPRPAAAVLGGDPGDMIYDPGPDEGLYDKPGLAITSTGVMFAVLGHRDAEYQSDIVILRSEDHGRSWSEWSLLADPGGGDIRYPEVEIVSGSHFELLIVSYLKVSDPHEIWVCRTIATDPVPAWNREMVEQVAWTGGDYPRCTYNVQLATRSSTTDPAVVAVAYWIETAQYDYELHYSVSQNAAINFAPPVVVFDPAAPTDGSMSPDVEIGFGELATVHLVALRRSFGSTPGDYSTKINHVAAGNDGATAADWSSPSTVILDEEGAYYYLTLASDPQGDDVVIGFHDGLAEEPEIRIHGSLDGGATWSPALIENASSYAGIELFWTALGPLATASDGDAYVILRPDGGPLGLYEAAEFLRSNGNTQFPGHLVLDPSQGLQAAMLTKMKQESTADVRPWFNADWRDEPGYGVAQREWQRSLNDGYDHYLAAPGVADLDGDGLMEIVIAGEPDTLWAYAGGGATRGTDRSYAMGAAGTVSVPVIFDLDGDEDLEVVVGGPDGRLHLLDHQLAPLAGSPVALGGGDVHVSAAPVTGLRAGEIVAVQADRVHLLDVSGAERSGWPYTAPLGTAVGRAAIGDVDGDGEVEVVAAFTSGVYILGPGGQLEALVLETAAAPSASVTLVDVDADGDLELAVPMSDGTVELIHHDGTTVDPAWPYDTGTGSPVLGVAAARVWNAGGEILCFSTASGSVFALDPDGVPLPGYPVAVAAGDSAACEPVVARTAAPAVDRPQLLVTTPAGWLYQWRAQGEPPADWPNFYDLEPALSPVAADVDADGIVEIVLAAGHRIYVLDTGTPPLGDERRRWPMAGHDLARSGCADCLPEPPTAAPDQAPAGATRVFFAGAHPNPAPGRTSFSFAMTGADEVELAVYDLRGRRVRGFGRRTFGEGQHLVSWDGRDGRGAPVASGVYLARLTVGRGDGSEVVTRRVMVRR